MIQVLTAAEHHIEELLQTYRIEEGIEITELDPGKIMTQALAEATHSWVAIVDGKLVAMLGIKRQSLLSRRGYVWLCTTTTIDARPFVFARASKIFLEGLKNEYTELYGQVLGSNTRSIKWLKWLGFELSPPPAQIRTFSLRTTNG